MIRQQIPVRWEGNSLKSFDGVTQDVARNGGTVRVKWGRGSWVWTGVAVAKDPLSPASPDTQLVHHIAVYKTKREG